MPKQSAGVLVYRKTKDVVEVLLVHPGGPFWSKKDTWSIPKGELEPDEDLLSGARREFEEEVGVPVPPGELIDLGQTKQSGKTNFIWAVAGDADITSFKSNTFTMEWPPHSGQQQEFPENDRAAWFDLAVAKAKLFKAQTDFIDRLAAVLGIAVADAPVANALESALDEPPQQQSLL